jgi:aminomethyltransferase
MHQTPLNAFHREHNARLVDFAGWEMPLMYTGIVDEHIATRQHCTVFDVSHMGRVEFRGPDAAALMEKLNTRNIGSAKPGMCRYSHMCKEDGGILDDVIVSVFDDHFLVVCNASNREKLLGWWEQQANGLNVEINDRTLETAMVAIQGPEAFETLDNLLPVSLGELKRYRFMVGNLFGAEYYVARSGYTGEDGVEIIVPSLLASSGLNMLMEQAANAGRPIRPAGLGSRDTLRLEAGMPLYGHELTEEWDSITAGQGWAVDLSKDFIGKDVLQRVHDEGPERQGAGLVVEGKRIARQGAEIQLDGQSVGVVTSGTQSPTLEKNIAMGLLRRDLCEPGQKLEVDIRGRSAAAEVVTLPFYKRS